LRPALSHHQLYMRDTQHAARRTKPLGDDDGARLGATLGVELRPELGEKVGPAWHSVMGWVVHSAQSLDEDDSATLGGELRSELGKQVEPALSLGDEPSASHGAFSLTTISERLGDDLRMLLGESLGDDDKKSNSATYAA
jgi:hypothetical protein